MVWELCEYEEWDREMKPTNEDIFVDWNSRDVIERMYVI